MSSLWQTIHTKIQKGETMSPFLFLSPNSEIWFQEVQNLAHDLLQQNDIDTNSLFTLSDTWEQIKIEEMRTFLEKWNTKPRFIFQIFLIENIGRMTLQSANAALKFFEEPGFGNIVFLTNTSESWILDTILSRVQIVRQTWGRTTQDRQDYRVMVESYFASGDTSLITFLYTQKLEKQDYKDMLLTMFTFLSQSGSSQAILEELEKDMQWLESNNLNGKYVVDKYLVS